MSERDKKLPIQLELAAGLKYFRARADERQADLAEAIGKSPGAIAQLETAMIWLTARTLQDICDHYQVDAMTLFRGARELPREEATPDRALEILAKAIHTPRPSSPLEREILDTFLPVIDDESEVRSLLEMIRATLEARPVASAGTAKRRKQNQ